MECVSFVDWVLCENALNRASDEHGMGEANEKEQKMNQDPNIWRRLPHGGLIKREWLFTGESRGVKCQIPVELRERIETPDGAHYWISPLAAMHVLHCPDSGVIGRNLVPIE